MLRVFIIYLFANPSGIAYLLHSMNIRIQASIQKNGSAVLRGRSNPIHPILQMRVPERLSERSGTQIATSRTH